jgi:hypothetical protein
MLSGVGGEIWGTFSVKDHCHTNAFAREVLLFDRLVLPFPATAEERRRWEHPNADDPAQTWDPGRLDVLLDILGSQQVQAQPAPRRGWPAALAGQRRAARSPAPAALAWQSPWDQKRWQFERSRLFVARDLSGFGATRSILTQDPGLPNVIEAVAAFPSETQWREELAPSGERPADLTAAQGLIRLATPLLVPGGAEGRDFGPLRAAAELARDEQFRQERQAYYDWMREFVRPLQRGGGPGPGEVRLDEVELNEASFEVAREHLRVLADAERRLLGKREQRRWWTRTEFVATMIGVGAGVAVALTGPLAAIGVAGSVIGFGGWLAGQRAVPEPGAAGPLGGASMFVSAQRQLGWPT